MSYVLKSSFRTKDRVPMPLKILMVMIVILVLFYLVFPRAFPTFFTTLIKPFWTAEQGIRYGDTSIEELRKILAASETNTAQNNALMQENADLKSLLGRSSLTRPLLATVLKRPPFSAYDTLILDVGKELKVEPGNRVYALGNIPIGEIAEVIDGTSKVRLYSSAGEKFQILIGPTHIEATATGRGGGYFEVSLPRDTKIKVGDNALISSLGNSFVGTVEGTASEPSEPFSKILFRQPVNIYEMRWVLVDTIGTSTDKKL